MLPSDLLVRAAALRKLRWLRGLAAPIAVMLGSAFCYLVLTLGAKAMARNLQKAPLDRLNILAGILLIGLGVALLGRIA
jgi:threonine/homoserine/homoserine lactone efflux protein